MHEIQKFILENIKSHPKNIVRVSMEYFGVTRAAVLFHLSKLKAKNLITQTGSRTKVHYYLSRIGPTKSSKDKHKEFAYKVGSKGEDEIWKSDIESSLKDIPQNVFDICKYGFTEIYNNVIDHSESKNAIVKIEATVDDVKIIIEDFGIGIFNKVAKFFRFSDLREAVIKIHQGKVTTDNTKHTGQGIFFTSRAFDQFMIFSNGFIYFKDSTQSDEWYWERSDNQEKGTHVELKISLNSKRKLKDIFDAYTNEDNYQFDKSHIRIELASYEEDTFISRSQAKRILHGLKDFKTLILDFKNIRNVGQAFVDEVFGVYGLEHNQIKFIIINANDDVLFMIKRGLKDRDFPQTRVGYS